MIETIAYTRMFMIALATGFGLGFGFWSAHLFCRQFYKTKDKQ